MRTIVLLAAVAMPGATVPAQAQQVKQFKDWLAACDNLRDCSAFGFEDHDNPNGSYIRITRAGGADARPAVAIYFDVPEGVKAPGLRLSMAGQQTTGQQTGGVPTAALPGPNGQTRLDDSQVSGFLAALHTATALKIAVLDGAKPVGASDVSLAGASAALRFMDAEQMRAGGVTALVAKGAAPSSDVPPAPPLPTIPALPISQIAAPPPPPPGVGPSEDCRTGPGADSALIAFRLSPELTLWGACQDWGAYNADYRLFVAGHGRVTPLTISGFDVPGQPPRPHTRGMLTWPGLSDDRTTITSMTKDEGLGDCGVSSDWVWDGQTLRLLKLRAMPVCRGVSSTDWPLVFTAAKAG